MQNQDGPEITLKASGTLAALQFHIVTLDTAGRVKQATDADVAVEPMLGVLQNEPTAIDQEAVVRVSGVAKVMFTGIIAPGVAVTTDTSGHAVAAVANDWVLGVTLETSAAGGLAAVLLGQVVGYVVPT